MKKLIVTAALLLPITSFAGNGDSTDFNRFDDTKKVNINGAGADTIVDHGCGFELGALKGDPTGNGVIYYCAAGAPGTANVWKKVQLAHKDSPNLTGTPKVNAEPIASQQYVAAKINTVVPGMTVSTCGFHRLKAVDKWTHKSCVGNCYGNSAKGTNKLTKTTTTVIQNTKCQNKSVASACPSGYIRIKDIGESSGPIPGNVIHYETSTCLSL